LRTRRSNIRLYKHGNGWRICYYDLNSKLNKIYVGKDYNAASDLFTKFTDWLNNGLDPKEKYREYKNLEIVEEIETIKVKEEPPTPIFIDKKVGDTDWRSYLDLCTKHQELYNRSKWTQDVCKIKIDTESPVAITYSADWHLGSLGVDYTSWKTDVEYLLNTNNLYEIVIGDLIDNFTKFKSMQPVLSQLISPEEQKAMLESLLLELVKKDKLLAAFGGNHDVGFDKRITGQSSIETFMSRLIPFVNGKGIVKLNVGNESYTMLILHKTRFNSYLHNLHGVKQEYRNTFPADVVATAHTHVPSFEMFHQYDLPRELGYDFGGETYLIKAGTYNTECEFSKMYWSKGKIGAPTVVLFPDRHKMVAFSCAEDAMTYINGLT
jgi:hypothetical protein